MRRRVRGRKGTGRRKMMEKALPVRHPRKLKRKLISISLDLTINSISKNAWLCLFLVALS